MMGEYFMGRLDGKVALVTGAGNGIGRATAIRFAAEGAKVILTTRNEDHGMSTLSTIRKTSGEAVFFQANVRDKNQIQELVRKAKEVWSRIDVLVNCAGVLVHKPFLEHTDEDFALICETNFRSYVWMMQEVLPIMSEQHAGSVINIASISVMKPELFAYFYGAFKAAVNKLTIDVAKEFGPQGVRLNVVCPGPVNTGMTPPPNPDLPLPPISEVVPLGRLGEPEDIANMNLFLASDESSWCTGSTYVCDGGVNIND
jgi:NAD(P)-dependent dehydrogenase (short-subunit alcohol dehydrogenase family)